MAILESKLLGYGNMGGIVGNLYARGTTENTRLQYCSYQGTVTSVATSTSAAGGLVGVLRANYASTVRLNHCRNLDAVTGTYQVGGLVGSVTSKGDSTVLINQCYNTGTLSGQADVGGLIGAYVGEGLTLTRCENNGSLSALGELTGQSFGGVLGRVGLSDTSTGTLTLGNCTNTAPISAYRNVGGLIGRATNTTIEIQSSLNAGALLGQSLLGGIVGASEEATISLLKCQNQGVLTGYSNQIGRAHV